MSEPKSDLSRIVSVVRARVDAFYDQIAEMDRSPRHLGDLLWAKFWGVLVPFALAVLAGGFLIRCHELANRYLP